MVADSALGRDGQPWFVPDFGSQWRWKVMLAVRVSRLGKSISEKFAMRYVDAMTLLFVPECDDDAAPVLLGCMDGGAVPGQWQPLPDGNDIVTVNDATISLSTLKLNQFVALTSRHTTLKTGDILALEIPGAENHAALQNSKVNLTLNGKPALTFNIK